MRALRGKEWCVIKLLRFLCITAVLRGLAACSSISPNPVQSVPFIWGGGIIDGQKFPNAAILVPVGLKGCPEVLYMQLDTGSAGSFIYQNSLSAVGKKCGNVSKTIGNTSPTIFEIAGKELGVVASLLPNAGGEVPGQPVLLGTLGLSAFTESILVLDYPNASFYICTEQKECDHLESTQSFVYQSATMRNGKLFLTAQVGDQQFDAMAFDTGASIFPMVVTKTRWQALLSRHGDEPDNQILNVPSWAKLIRCVGATSSKTVVLAGRTLSNPVVFFCGNESDDHPSNISKYPFKIDGVIGNAPFVADTVVVIDQKRSRIAFAKSLKSN
jgi:hypothetical protein